MEKIQLVLGILAGVLHATAFILYINQVYKGHSKPKFATWAIGAALMLLNALTFRKMGNSGAAIFQFFVGFVGSFAVLSYCLVARKFSWPNRAEILASTIGLVAAIVWAVFRQATWANMVVLVALLTALWPTFETVRRNPFSDRSRSWVIWALAYGVTTCNVALGAYQPDWHAVLLVNPIVSALAHGLVAYMASKIRRNLHRIQRDHRERWSILVTDSILFGVCVWVVVFWPLWTFVISPLLRNSK